MGEDSLVREGGGAGSRHPGPHPDPPSPPLDSFELDVRIPIPEPAVVASISGPSSPHLTPLRLLHLAGTCDARALLLRGRALVCDVGAGRDRWGLDLKRKESSTVVCAE
jgi:hypothetical protein